MKEDIPDTEITTVIIPPEDGSLKRFSPDSRSKFTLKNTFAALQHPNYKLWFWGQMISLFGSWMHSTALAFFIFELTKSPAFLGYAGFAGGIPAWLFTFYGGVIADRFPRRIILIYIQSFMMIMAFTLSVMAFTEIVEPWHILIFAFLMGIATSIDAPTRHSFVTELVERKNLVNAIALNSTMFNTATAIGPALGGIIYALFGPAWCFTINGFSYLAVIINLNQMKLKSIKNNEKKKSAFAEFIEAFNYLKTQKNIISILSVIAMLSIFGMSLVTLFPAWAVDILNGDSTTNGFMQSARGFGAVIFALIIATASHNIIRGKYLIFSAGAMPVMIFFFSFNRSLIISLLLLVIIGGLIIAQFNLANGLIQTMVEEKFRGRVMSFYTFSFFALFPLGSLLIGSLAENFGVPLAITINSSVLFVYFVIFYLKHLELKRIK